MSRDDDRVSNPSAAALARSLPDVIEALHTTTGPLTAAASHTGHGSGEDDDEAVSPSSSPSRAALTAHARSPRFPLSPVEENHLVRRHAQQAHSWTWDTRYTSSTTLTVAESTSTAYFCVDFPEKLRKRISTTVHSLQALAKNPLFMDTLIIDEIINFYRDVIKTHRGQMLAMVCLSFS